MLPLRNLKNKAVWRTRATFTALRPGPAAITLRLSAMRAKAETQFSARTTFAGDDYDDESDRFELGDKTVPRIEGMFRLGNRHRLLFNCFRYSEDRKYVLDERIDLGEIGVPAGAAASLDTDFDLGGLVYDFAVIETPTTSFGLQIGAQRAKLTAHLRVTSDSGETYSARQSERGAAPVPGVRLGLNTQGQRGRFVVQGQYLDAGWGDFDNDNGELTRANAGVEYRFTDHFGRACRLRLAQAQPAPVRRRRRGRPRPALPRADGGPDLRVLIRSAAMLATARRARSNGGEAGVSGRMRGLRQSLRT